MSKTKPCPHCGRPIKVGAMLKEFDKSPRTCQVCGKEFLGGNKAKYCSNACTQRAKYACQKAARTEKEGK